MINFVQVSGGRTSGYMAYLLKDEPNCVFMFQNTGRERPETLNFLNKIDIEFKLNLVWLEYYCPDPLKKATFKQVNFETANREGLPFSQLIDKRNCIPNKFKRFCTSELKVKTARRWIRANNYKKWKYSIGFRADEPHRKTKSDTMQTVVTPLRDMGITSKEVSNFWRNNYFDLELPLLPNGKTFGGNCEGCFWHSEYQHAMLCKYRPQAVKWLIDQEKKMGYSFNENYTYEEMMEKVKNLPEKFFSDIDYFCMSENGSCGS